MLNVKRTLSALVIMALATGCGGALQESADPSGLQRVSVPTAPLAGASDPNQAVSSDKPAPAADQTAANQPAASEPAKEEPAKEEPAKAEPAPAQPVQSQPATEPAPQQPAPSQGSSAPAKPPSGPVQFQVVQQGAYSGVSEQMAVLITDEAGWNQHWRAHASTQVPAPSAPAVDFSKWSLLAIYMGEKSSGGYGLEVLSIQQENGKLSARVRQIAPGPGDMVTMALTQPYQIVQIPKVAADTKLDIIWE